MSEKSWFREKQDSKFQLACLGLWPGSYTGHMTLDKQLYLTILSFHLRGWQQATEVLGGLKESLHPGEMKTYVHIKTCTVIFTAALFITAKKWK